jgi:hypothetical protein
MSRRGPVTGSPESTTLPFDGDNSPAMILSRVDFPQPLGPMIAEKPPSVKLRSILSSACTLRLSKVLLTPSNS